MKKKNIAIFAAAGILIASGFALSVTASPKEDAWVQKWGKILSDHYSSQQRPRHRKGRMLSCQKLVKYLKKE